MVRRFGADTEKIERAIALGLGAILALLVLEFAVLRPVAAAAGGQLLVNGGLLVNGSFETGWKHQGAAELYFPDPWALEYRNWHPDWCGDPCKRPEVTQSSGPVVDGAYSVRAFAPAHSRAVFALYQEFQVEPSPAGSPPPLVTLTCQVYATSDPESGLLVSAAVQPWAGSFFGDSAIRGEATRARNEWTTVSVTAPVYGEGKGKAGIWYRQEWPGPNNSLWIDDCELALAAGCGSCPECPTCPPPDGLDWAELYKVVRQAVEVELGRLRLVAE